MMVSHVHNFHSGFLVRWHLNYCLYFILTIFSHYSSVHGHMIEIDTDVANECFHERVPSGIKLALSFEVIEGGFYDIDIDIKDPNNNLIHRDTRASNGKFTFESNMEGPFQFCFHNNMVSRHPKSIIFDIDRSDVVGVKSSLDKSNETNVDSEVTRLTGMIESLMLATISSRHDVRYLLARDRIHRRLAEKTNSTIVWWTGIEFILLLAVTLGQVWYLRRFFEIRRKA